MKTAIMQNGIACFGVGGSLTEAIDNAREWTDSPLDNLPCLTTGPHGLPHGEMCYAKCTDAYAAAVKSRGGDIAYKIVNDIIDCA